MCKQYEMANRNYKFHFANSKFKTMKYKQKKANAIFLKTNLNKSQAYSHLNFK